MLACCKEWPSQRYGCHPRRQRNPRPHHNSCRCSRERQLRPHCALRTTTLSIKHPTKSATRSDWCQARWRKRGFKILISCWAYCGPVWKNKQVYKEEGKNHPNQILRRRPSILHSKSSSRSLAKSQLCCRLATCIWPLFHLLPLSISCRFHSTVFNVNTGHTDTFTAAYTTWDSGSIPMPAARMIL